MQTLSIIRMMILLGLTACQTPPETDQPVRRPTLSTPDQKTPLKPIPGAEASPPKARTVQNFPGSGDFVRPSNRERAITRQQSDDTVSVNLVDATIEAAANTILGQILGRNYVVQEGVTGTITLQTSEPISTSALLPILEDVLKAQNIALVEHDGLFEILPLAVASTRSQAIVLGNSEQDTGAGYRTIIRPLDYISATEISEILGQLATEGGVLRTDAARNLIVLGGTSRELETMLEVVNVFDADWLGSMSFAIVPVSSTSPDNIVREMEAVIFSGNNTPPFSELLRLVPNERLGAIIVMSPKEHYIRDATEWIRRLDAETATATEQLYLYNVQNALAEDLSLILQNIIAGGSNGFSAIGGVAPGLDIARAQRPGNTADEANLPTVGPSRARGRSSAGGLSGLESVRIFPYEGRNAIAIVATADQYRRMQPMLETLDVAANQVLLEATIVEVTLRDELSRGVRWFFGDEESEITFSDVMTGAIAPSFPGFAYTFDNGDDIRVAIDALSSITDVNFLSSPSIMVLDNATATLQVGDEVPIATQSAVGVLDPASPIVNTVSFRDTGVILTITPRVNDSGLVLLEITQEVSDVVPTVTSGIDSPTIQQRRIETTVAVQDGASLALGGLIEDSVSTTQTGVPFVSQVPILGELFKSQTDIADRTELLIIITPRVVRNLQEADEVTNEFRERLQGIAPIEGRLRRRIDEAE